ncbi:hypothetical protein [Rhodococcus sp. SBT000017]|nr:hypothetical protein [Rhodococcus sp. SBT000017]
MLTGGGKRTEKPSRYRFGGLVSQRAIDPSVGSNPEPRCDISPRTGW